MTHKSESHAAGPQSSAKSSILVVAELPQKKASTFDIKFDAAQLALGRDQLGLVDLQKTRISGELHPEGRHNWRLVATVGASVMQACVVTLAPVKARVDSQVERLFLANWEEPEGESVMEMTMDENSEPLTPEIDLIQIALEAIALAMPDYPRAPDAALETTVFADENVVPMTDEDAKPFAGLAALKAKMEK